MVHQGGDNATEVRVQGKAHQNNQTTFKSSMFYNQGTKEHEYIPIVKCADLVVTQGVKTMIRERPIYGKRG
ncbi:hypothetical protein ECG_04247 [Echinococcus granulosus]|uniref:Expressed protein n=1 Tax=Echinococcus granulosus TaxID=6210 RepID=A0A068WBJ9_ECHGR|nr:hypothetical protein ECG_04247 [Echinococcus granulosus]CDS17467.1 expressed protein [Echinococcus granulosus]